MNNKNILIDILKKEFLTQKKSPPVRKPSVLVFILGGIIWGLLHLLFNGKEIPFF